MLQVLAIAVDSNENLYIWDAGGANAGQRLLLVNPSTGMLNNVQLPVKANGFPPGVGATSPGVGQNAFAIDSQGNFFIGSVAEVDEVSATLRRIAGTGTVGSYQGEGGPATQALLGGLLAVAVDPSGNVFIADPGNYRIYRVDHISNVITTVAGGGPAASLCAEGKPGNQIAISQSAFLAINSSGDVIFPDSYCYKVRKIDHTTGIVSTLVGTGSDGSSPDGTLGTAAKISAGSSIGFPVLPGLRTGDLYLVDGVDDPFANPFYAGRVRKVAAANGQLVTIAGSGARSYSGDGNPPSQAQLQFPEDVAVDGTGNVYIADAANNRIRKIDGKTGLISTVAGTGNNNFNGDGPALTTNLNDPSGVAIDHNGNLLISDTGNGRIRRLVNGAISTVAGGGQYPSGPIGGPVGDGGPALNAVLVYPSGLSVDPLGNIYIADTGDNKIRRVALNQTISTVAGSGGFLTGDGDSGDGGPAINAQLSNPRGIAFDPQGNLLIAAGGCVRKVSFGTISSFAGVCGVNRIAVDGTGTVFLSRGQDILKVTPDGVVASVAGAGFTSGYAGDGGPAALALLNGSVGLTFDNNGGLLIADAGNGMIRRLSIASQPTLTVAGVTNGASFRSGLVADSIGTIFGTNLTTMLGGSSSRNNGLPLPLQLEGTSVQINGSNAPIFGVANVNGQQQINFQVPWEAAGQQSATVAVTNYGASNQPVNVPIFTAQPGIFTDATGNAAALHGATNLPIASNAPATKGEVIALFATGLGPVSAHPQDGTTSDSQTTTLQPTVTIGGADAPVQYSGLAPGLVGCYQLNVTVPATAGSGTLSVVATMNGVSSNSAKLPVQ